jgi:hypothetical protein
MKSTENTSSTQARKKTQPEEIDLVILGGGMGSTIAAWTFAAEGKRVAVVVASILAALALILRAFRARTSSTARKSHRTFAEARSSALRSPDSPLTCRACVNESARW